jgi:hypothetical protein
MAAHVHSDWSYDGSWTLDRLAAAFARRGYRAVLMAEHSQTFSAAKWLEYRDACARASRPDLLLVPGVEYADADDVLHLPVWGEVPFLGQAPAPGAVAEAVSQAGAVAVLAHPWRRDAWRRIDPQWLALLSAVEIWNRKYDGWAPRRAACELAAPAGLGSFVSLDFHTRRQFFPLAMTTVLPAGAVTVPAVYRALREGRCRPELLGIPAARFSSGGLGAAAAAAERARGVAARAVRRIRG